VQFLNFMQQQQGYVLLKKTLTFLNLLGIHFSPSCANCEGHVASTNPSLSILLLGFQAVVFISQGTERMRGGVGRAGHGWYGQRYEERKEKEGEQTEATHGRNKGGKSIVGIPNSQILARRPNSTSYLAIDQFIEPE